jgi:hypothetical protein
MRREGGYNGGLEGQHEEAGREERLEEEDIVIVSVV